MTVGNCNTLPISSIGKLSFSTHTQPLHLKDILIVSHLIADLLSVAKFVKDNSCLIEFHPFGYVVKDFHTRILLLTGNIHNNLYPMKIPFIFRNHVAFATRHTPLNLWHQQLGHLCQVIISRLSRSLFSKSNVIKTCSSWFQGKRTRLPYSLST